MKKFIAFISLVSLTLAIFPALAVPPVFESAQLYTPVGPKILVLPSQAVEHSPVFLGTAVDPESGKVVEGYAIIHPKKGYHHRPGHSGGKGGPGNGDSTSSCFAYLSKGAKWKTVEPWVVNTANIEGLSESFVSDTITQSIAKWEDAADGQVNSVEGANILGDGSVTASVLVADNSSPDGVNEVYFGEIDGTGAIAVTIVWGVFSGPPFARELVEWDQIYDQVEFDWSSAGEAGKMDFENIATHELGHSIGLGHPSDDCTEETMFRFASEGDTAKRDLHAGDIAGVDGLY
jgi:hypothetical protein